MFSLQNDNYNFDRDINFLSHWGEVKNKGETIGHHLYLGDFSCVAYFSNPNNPDQGEYSWELRYAQNTGDVVIGSGKNTENYYIGNCKDALKYYIWHCESEDLNPYFRVETLKVFL